MHSGLQTNISVIKSKQYLHLYFKITINRKERKLLFLKCVRQAVIKIIVHKDLRFDMVHLFILFSHEMKCNKKV